MNIRFGFVALIVSLSITASSQNVDSLSNKLDSLKKKSDTSAVQQNNISSATYNERTKITAGVYGALLLSDLKQQALSPFTVGKRQWMHNLGFAAAAVALTFADKPVQKWAVKVRQNNSWVQPTSRTITNVGGAYQIVTFVGLASYGYIAKNEKIRTTTFLASQAYLTSTIWETIFKELSGRTRPAYYKPNTIETDPSFHGPFYKLPLDSNGHRTNSAFPSGHTAIAFAAATVYAMEYRNIPAVPIIAYGAATLIGASRLMLNRHWLTDVFVGAGIGLLCGRQVVNNYHRYSKLKRGVKGQPRPVTFSVDYSNGHIQPAMVYRF